MRHLSKRPSATRSAATVPAPAVMQAMQAAVKAHRAGNLQQAIQAYRAAIRVAPAFAEAHHNLGIALKAVGQGMAAEKALREAVRLRPDYSLAHAALANQYERTGQAAKALRQWLTAYAALPGDVVVLNGLVRVLGPMRFTQADTQLVATLSALLRRDDVEGQRLVGAGLSLLALDRSIKAALESSDPASLPVVIPELLLALLERTVIADAAWERLLTRLRAELLTDFRSLNDDRAPLASALAVQMLATDYAYAVSDPEAETIAGLKPDGAALTADHVRLALYAPLPGDSVALESPAGWAPFCERHLQRPTTEREAAATTPALTAIEDTVSRAVEDQYSALPYPRWLSTRAALPRSRSAILRDILPIRRNLPDAKPLRVLVAGCGTGKHAVDVATRFADADVLAIDLSRPSLGYARAQAERLGISNVRFGQADIMALGSLAERFDHIEAMGVLHHLREPLTGWRVLRGLLAEAGTMRIGLYARRGRSAIQAAQRLAADYGRDANGLRALRQAILALPAQHAAAAMARELDFYTLNGVRDALAHAQEHDFTPLELQRLLSALELEFLGFETVTSQPQHHYRAAFPDDPAMADLAKWDALEQRHPDLFHHMYQFWCCPA